MARKTKADAAITREQLLDAAERVFRERGVTRTSLAEIAAEAGVTRGAVYWHFRDKADLFAAMCQRATSPMDTMVERAHAARQASPLATLRSLCIEALEHLAADPRAQAVFEIIFHKSELAGELAGVGERHDRDCRDCRTRLQAVVERAIAAGELPADTDAALATHALNAYFTGLMHEWTLDPSAYDLKRSAPAFIDTFLAGLAANPPRRAKPSPGDARTHPTAALVARGRAGSSGVARADRDRIRVRPRPVPASPRRSRPPCHCSAA